MTSPLKPTFPLLLLVLPTISHAETPPPVRDPVKEPDQITVHGKREKPEEGLERKEIYDEQDIENADVFTAKELVDSLPEGPAGTQPVVLVDGKETDLDLSSLPVEMVQQVEVFLDGDRPDGAPRAEGQVINVKLYRNYVGASLNARQRGSFEGGGGNLEAMGHGAYKRGDLNIIFSASRNENYSLLASDREFSREQDRTADGGRDFRLPWGATPSVQALSGTLNGVFDDAGNAVSTAITPEDAAPGGLGPDDFIAGPAGVTSASGLQRFNSAGYQYLANPSTADQVSLIVNYPLTPRTTIGARVMYRQNGSHSLAPPPITSATDDAVVPGAYNPFGQDIAIGMVHTGFGPVRGNSESAARSFALTGSGYLGQKFRWNAEAGIDSSDADSGTRELDPIAFSAALAAADPALRFNPFAVDDSLYDSLARLRTSTTDSTRKHARVSLAGAVSEGWVEPIFVTMHARSSSNDSEQVQPAVSDIPLFFSNSDNRSRSADASLSVPLFKVTEAARAATLTLTSDWSRDDQQLVGSTTTTHTDLSRSALTSALRTPWIADDNKRPGLYRLETEVGIGRRTQTGQDSARTSRLSGMWAPIEPLSLRVTFNSAENPPRGFFDFQSISYNQTLFDRHRNVPTATNVEVMRGIPLGLGTAASRARMVDLQFEPPQFERLRVGVTYTARDQRDIVRQLSAQDVVDNEAALPGRVVRAPQTADDIAAGQPGALVSVDTTPLNAGRSRDEAMEFSTRYRGEQRPWGTLELAFRATRVLDRTDELLPGVPFVTSDESNAPPDWVMRGSVDWRRGAWLAGAGLAHRAEGYYAGLPYAAYSTLDLSAGYTFQQPFIGKFGRRAQLRLEIGNVLDEQPPLVDTLIGYFGGSPLGRTYQLTMRMPLGNVRGGDRGGMRRGGRDRGGDGEDEMPNSDDNSDRDRDWDRGDDFPRRGGGGRPMRR